MAREAVKKYVAGHVKEVIGHLSVEWDGDQENDRHSFLKSIERHVGSNLTFTRKESFTAQLNGSELDATHLPEGYIVTARKPSLIRGLLRKESPIDSVTLQRALKEALFAANVDDAYIHRTDQGVWIGAGTVDELMRKNATTQKYVTSELQGYAQAPAPYHYFVTSLVRRLGVGQDPTHGFGGF